MKRAAATVEDDIVPFNWTGQVQTLKNLQRTRSDKDYADKYYDVSNSNDFSFILMSQDPKLKAWIQGVIHCKSCFKIERKVILKVKLGQVSSY